MKLIFLLLFASCSFLGVRNKDPLVGESLSGYIKNNGEPVEKKEWGQFSFIAYYPQEVLVFEDSNFREKITLEEESYSVNIKVSSLSDSSYSSKNNKAYLFPGNNLSVESLEFKFLSSKIRTALILKGYDVVDDIEESAIVVLISSSISEPINSIKSASSPVFGYEGPSTSNFNAYSSSGNWVSGGITTPGRGFYQSGTKTSVWSETKYNRSLELVAIDTSFFQKNKTLKEVWTLHLTSLGYSGDLKNVVSILSWVATFKLNQTLERVENITVNNGDSKYLIFNFLSRNHIKLNSVTESLTVEENNEKFCFKDVDCPSFYSCNKSSGSHLGTCISK